MLRAFADLRADGAAAVVGAVADIVARDRRMQLLAQANGRIAVSARRRHALGGVEDARAGDDAGRDGVAKRGNRGRAAQVAHRREARAQRAAHVHLGLDQVVGLVAQSTCDSTLSRNTGQNLRDRSTIVFRHGLAMGSRVVRPNHRIKDLYTHEKEHDFNTRKVRGHR